MSDRDDTHEDAINGDADAQGAEGLDRGVDDAFVNIANHGCSSTVVS